MRHELPASVYDTQSSGCCQLSCEGRAYVCRPQVSVIWPLGQHSRLATLVWGALRFAGQSPSHSQIDVFRLVFQIWNSHRRSPSTARRHGGRVFELRLLHQTANEQKQCLNFARAAAPPSCRQEMESDHVKAQVTPEASFLRFLP